MPIGLLRLAQFLFQSRRLFVFSIFLLLFKSTKVVRKYQLQLLHENMALLGVVSSFFPEEKVDVADYVLNKIVLYSCVLKQQWL